MRRIKELPQPTLEPKPTFSGITKLLKVIRVLNRKNRYNDGGEIAKLSETYRKRERQLMKDHTLQKLDKEIFRLKKIRDKQVEEVNLDISKFERELWAYGVTPKLITKLNKLIAETNALEA